MGILRKLLDLSYNTLISVSGVDFYNFRKDIFYVLFGTFLNKKISYYGII